MLYLSMKKTMWLRGCHAQAHSMGMLGKERLMIDLAIDTGIYHVVLVSLSPPIAS